MSVLHPRRLFRVRRIEVSIQRNMCRLPDPDVYRCTGTGHEVDYPGKNDDLNGTGNTMCKTSGMVATIGT